MTQDEIKANVQVLRDLLSKPNLTDDEAKQAVLSMLLLAEDALVNISIVAEAAVEMRWNVQDEIDRRRQA